MTEDNANTPSIPEMDPATMMAAMQEIQKQFEQNEMGRARIGVLGNVTDEQTTRAQTLLEGCLHTLNCMDQDNCDLVLSTKTNKLLNEIARKVGDNLGWPTIDVEDPSSMEIVVYLGAPEELEEFLTGGYEGPCFVLPLVASQD